MAYLVADLSNFQAGINMAALKAAGVSAVILKATEGTGYRSPAFRAQAQQAAAQGLTVSAYAFLHPGDGAAQGRYFLDALSGVVATGVRVFADFEAAGTTHQTLHDFTMTVGAQRPVGVYSYGPFWLANGQSSCAHCAALPLWFARYGAKPTPPPPWSTWDLWQYTDKFPVDGRLIDMSTTDDLAVLTGGATPIPEDDMLKNDPDLQAAIKQLNDRMDARDRSLTWLQDTAKQQAGALGVLTSSASQLQQTINGLSLPAGITAEALAKALLEQLAAK